MLLAHTIKNNFIFLELSNISSCVREKFLSLTYHYRIYFSIVRTAKNSQKYCSRRAGAILCNVVVRNLKTYCTRTILFSVFPSFGTRNDRDMMSNPKTKTLLLFHCQIYCVFTVTFDIISILLLTAICISRCILHYASVKRGGPYV